MKAKLLFLPLLLLACEQSADVDIKCDAHTVLGRVFETRAELKIDDIKIVLPLQGVFTDEYTAEYVPKNLSRPAFAMTVKNYVGLSWDEKKLDLSVFSRKGRVEYYELEIEGKKWQCH